MENSPNCDNNVNDDMLPVVENLNTNDDMSPVSQNSNDNDVLKENLDTWFVPNGSTVWGPDKLNILSSRIICSDNITRQSLRADHLIDDTSDDDEQFIEKLKSKIDKHPPSQSKESYAASYFNRSCWKKKKVFDRETEDVISRFKKNIEHKHFSRTPCTAGSDNLHKNITKQTRNVATDTTDTDTDNILQQEPQFSTRPTNIDFRKSSENIGRRNVLFDMAPNMSNDNHLFVTEINQTEIYEAGFEELVYCELECCTPPESYFIGDNDVPMLDN